MTIRLALASCVGRLFARGLEMCALRSSASRLEADLLLTFNLDNVGIVHGDLDGTEADVSHRFQNGFVNVVANRNDLRWLI